jgi:hypothetical protein
MADRSRFQVANAVVCWKLQHTQYSSHWNDGFGATDRVYCIDLDLSKFYSSGDPPFRGGGGFA